jgi:radical SAM superfamily enzyme YgiQ (UPF0313 family)
MASDDDMHDDNKNYNPPLGIMSIATKLEFHGYHAGIIDYCNQMKDIPALVQKVVEEEIKIVGFSVYTINVDEAIRISRYLKRNVPDCIIIFGGAHASLDTEYCCKQKSVDYVLSGEGETSFLELVEGIFSNFKVIHAEQIPGVNYIRRDIRVVSDIREHISDIDLLPIVKRHLVEIKRYNGMINLSTSRGCPANCIYCAGSKLGGRGYRVRNIENVILEISYIKNYIGDQINSIYFIDDTFTVVKKRVYKFLELKKKFHLYDRWRCESRVDIVDKELLTEISENGCITIHFGIESGSQDVLNKIMKKIVLIEAIEKIRLASELGIIVCCYFMLGHYCDTNETMQETCDLIKYLVKNYSIDATLHYNTPYPGTYQFQYRDELGIRMSSMNYRDFLGYMPMIETNNFTIDDQVKKRDSVFDFLNIHQFFYDMN